MSKEITTITKEEIKNKEIGFDYKLVDNETAQCMKSATERIAMLREKTQKNLGELFSTVQKKLSGNNQYNGYFGKWYTTLGFKKDFVYNCIDYYNLLIGNLDNQKIQELSFSKGCEVAKLKDTPDLQQEVIALAPLKEMKVKLIEKLVKEVKDKKEVTEELIEEICNKANESNNNFKQFVKTTTTFIKNLKEQKEEMTEANFEVIIKLVEEVKELCVKEEKNGGNG